MQGYVPYYSSQSLQTSLSEGSCSSEQSRRSKIIKYISLLLSLRQQNKFSDKLTTLDLYMHMIDLFLPRSCKFFFFLLIFMSLNHLIFLDLTILLLCSFAIVNVARKCCFVPSSGNLLSFASFNSGTPSRSLIIIAFRPLTL